MPSGPCYDVNENGAARMTILHIVQGDQHGDKRFLERAARERICAKIWTVPKKANVGDEVVIFIQGIGLFATAQINSEPLERVNWVNRYGAGLSRIRLIRTPVPLDDIKRRVRGLTWANYPRSITTPPLNICKRVQKLIEEFNTRPMEISESILAMLSLDELRRRALTRSKRTAPVAERTIVVRVRSAAVKAYILKRSCGRCEACRKKGPFLKDDGTYFIEPHHTRRVSDDGPDHPAHVIGLCPNCHRRAHHSADRETFNKLLIEKAAELEARSMRRQQRR